MSRRIITSQHQSIEAPSSSISDCEPPASRLPQRNKGRGTPPKKRPTSRVDTYSDRVVKYIPADIVAAWIAATDAINSTANVSKETVFWITFVIGLMITPLWILKQTSEPGKRAAITQTLISTGAFVVWVVALGGPFAMLDFYRPLYGTLLLIFYSLLAAIVVPKEG